MDLLAASKFKADGNPKEVHVVVHHYIKTSLNLSYCVTTKYGQNILV